MPQISFDRYYRYKELTDLLHAFAKEYPNLVSIESIGKSHEGKDIWLATVTDSITGTHDSKPAFWCDGNIHASEVSASTAVLYLLNKLCTQYGNDQSVTKAMQSRTFYLVPRLGPDGAEWALEDVPRIVRSGTRAYPYDEDDHYGLEREDIDGDGRILSIRIKDSNGAWKKCENEPRLMVRREPGETEGEFYRLMPEGVFHSYDPLTLTGHKMKEGLDFNRNFPSAWRQENDQYGAGDYPTSEPEIRACVEAIVRRPNICGAVTFHTFSGVHLRPPSRMPDEDIPAEDLWIYKTFGDKGEAMTGYPAISNYHEFRYHPKEVITGVFDDWAYEHRGIFAWTTELWSPQRQAGITDYKYIEWFRDHPVEHDLLMLKWSDEKLGGKGHIDWQYFDHPQLGECEIGGWDPHYAFRNPPPEFLEKEVSVHSDWVIWQAMCSPKLEKKALEITKISENAWKIRLAVQNTGYLPSYVSEMAKKKSLCRGVIGEISKVNEKLKTKGENSPKWLVQGRLRENGPQLAGRSHITASGFGWQMNGTDDAHVFEWVVSEPGDYQLVASHDRAGTVTEIVTVK